MTSLSLNSAGATRFVLSMVIVTSALLRAGLDCVPEKITSSIADARMDSGGRGVTGWSRGLDITVIALWLGHEDTATTHLYVEADLAMKEAALSGIEGPTPRRPVRFKAPDRLLAFLDAL